MRKLLCIFLTLLLVVSTVLFSVSAAKQTEPTAFGDMDGNLEVTASDALVILQGSVKKITLSNAQKHYADVNVDDQVTAADALTTLQYAVNKIVEIPTSNYKNYSQEDLLINKTESLLDNGAYGEDVSADCSFKITTEGLAENTIYNLSPGVFANLDTLLKLDFIRFITCLQGLVNRDYGITHTSLIALTTSNNDSDNFWFQYVTGEDKQFGNMQSFRISNIAEIFDIFEAQIKQCGLVLWDQSVPATANVANTMCGIDGCLPVKYDTTKESFYTYLKDIYSKKGVTLNEVSLVGKFTGTGTIVDTTLKSTGSTKCDAYLWAMDKYINRCSTNYLAYVVDGYTLVKDNPLSNKSSFAYDAQQLWLWDYDYLIARRCFFVDLSPQPGDIPNDDPTQTLGTDFNTLRRILLARYNRANGNFCIAIGFSPFVYKYSDSNSSLGNYDSVASEFLTVEVMTSFNVSVEADCPGPSSIKNQSLTYKYIATNTSFENGTPDDTIVYDSDTKYYTVAQGDYDSPAWMSYHFARFCNDAARGTLPLYWIINPNNSDRLPHVYEYIYSNKYENEFFSAGDSGVGYTWPAMLEEGFEMKTYGPVSAERITPDGFDKYQAILERYYKLFGYQITGFIHNQDLPISNSKILDMYNTVSPIGSFFIAKDSQQSFMYNGTPYLKLSNTDGYTTMKNSTYKFFAFRTVTNTPTKTKEAIQSIQDQAEAKGLKFQYVDPYTLFRLMRESNSIANWKYSK